MLLMEFPVDYVHTFHPDTDAPLHEVSTVPLVVFFQVGMSESELRPDIVHDDLPQDGRSE